MAYNATYFNKVDEIIIIFTTKRILDRVASLSASLWHSATF